MMVNSHKSKVLIAASLGNVLEFYDFTLYAIFAPQIATLFFPTKNHVVSLIAVFGVFALGFIVRPIGAILFGHIGDKMGRRTSLTLSIALMSFPTLLIGLTPTYSQIGILAPVFITLCRLLQGLCAGGEFSGSAIFVLEHYGRKNRGLIGGLLITTCVSGTLLASLIGISFNYFELPTESWRAGFILGAAIGGIGLYIRRRLKETEDFIKIEKLGRICRMPFMEVITKQKTSLYCLVGIGSLNGAVIYTIFGYSSVYLINFINLPANLAIASSILGLCSLMIASPLFGALSDKLTPRRVMLAGSLSVLFLAWPVYSLFNSGIVINIFLGQLLLGIAGASYVGPQHSLSMELFPVQDRYSGISLGYSLGMALMGGTTPMVSTILIKHTQNLEIPAVWLAMSALVAFIGVIISRPVSRLISNDAHALPAVQT